MVQDTFGAASANEIDAMLGQKLEREHTTPQLT